MRFILTLLFALFFAPHPAAASAPHEFYGVIAADDPDQTELARMGTGGVGTLRINLVWGAVESGPGAQFDWSHYDALIGEAAAQGIRVLPTVYSSPLWAAARDNYPPSPGSLGDYAAFVEAAAARYGSNGTFWAENPDIPRLPVRWWQFWNEPNLQVFWLPKLSARSYVDLLRVFSPAIRRGDPNARVLLAGLFPGPFITRRRRHTARALPPGDLPSAKSKNALRRCGPSSLCQYAEPRHTRRHVVPPDHVPIQGPEDATLAHRSGLDHRG